MHALTGGLHHRSVHRFDQHALNHRPGFVQRFQLLDAVGEQRTQTRRHAHLLQGHAQFLEVWRQTQGLLPWLHLARQRKFLAQSGHFFTQHVDNFVAALLFVVRRLGRLQLWLGRDRYSGGHGSMSGQWCRWRGRIRAGT